jgi:type I restriction enzyme S subunit
MQKSSNTQAVPIGWRIEPIGRAFRTVLGGTPSRAETKYWKYGDIPWINSSKVNEVRIIDETEFITRLGLENSSAKLMPKRTTVIAITGATLGQVSLLEIEACANQSVVGVFDEEGRYPEYIFLAIKHNIEDIISRASGGAQQHINKEVINAYPIIIPPKTIVDNFNEFVRPIFDLVRALALKNSVLRQARDLLLPRLISGELDLSDLDIAGDDDNS